MSADTPSDSKQIFVSWLEIVGAVLRLHRLAANRTQSDVAKAIGAAGHGSVARFERGVSSPSLEQLPLICRCCGTTPSALMRDADAARLLLEEIGVQVVDTRREIEDLGRSGACSRSRSALDLLKVVVDRKHGLDDYSRPLIERIRYSGRGLYLHDQRGDQYW